MILISGFSPLLFAYFSQLMCSNDPCASVSRYKYSHEIPDFPSTTGVLRRLICPKYVLGRGPAPDPAGGAHDAPTDPL